MLAYYGSHILHTAVAYFDVVLSVLVVGKVCCVSTGFEGVIIGSLSFVEFFFVAGSV